MGGQASGSILARIDAAIAELHAVRDEVAALLPASEGDGFDEADDFAPEQMIEITTAVERFNRPADSLRYLCRKENCGRKIGGRWLASVPRLRRRLNGE